MAPTFDATAPPLVELTDVSRRYLLARQHLWLPAPVVDAVRGVSLRLEPGRNLGIVGESGSGKSTLARLAMALEAPTSGTVRWSGVDPLALAPRELRAARADIQMVFQDPYGSLDPRLPVGHTVAEPLARSLPQAERRERVGEVLDAVGLRASDAGKYPHEFSGGQRQRIALARALVTRPKAIVADEPVSALDVSVQAQVLNLMLDLQQRLAMTYLFISHDLAVVDHVCEDVIVMQAGRVVEAGPSTRIFRDPQHAYTRALLAAVLPVA
jgi:peptide/nickel transport system ATP-binding protein